MEIKASLDNIDKAMQIARNTYPTLRFVQHATKRGNYYCGVRLRTATGRDHGARLSATGRRTVSASFEVHRVYMAALFDLEPNAIIKTSMATYRGKDDFSHKWRDVGLQNVGSRANPKRFAEL